MDRAEATGLGVAVAGHALLLAILSVGFATAVKTPRLAEPMEVAFVEEVGLESQAPTPSNEAPAPKLAEVEGPVEPAPPPLPEPVLEPVPQPQPRPVPTPPQPKAVERPQPKPTPQPVKRTPPPKPAPTQAKPAPAKPAPAKPAPAKPAASASARSDAPAKANARPTGRLSGLLKGISENDTKGKATTPPAKAAGPAVQASLAAEIRRQLKPHWRAPSGADVELLRTELSISLAPSGAVTDVEVVRTTGQNESNRAQVRLHQEQAVRAARLASPFRLPSEYYDAWRVLRPIFDKRLSQ